MKNEERIIELLVEYLQKMDRAIERMDENDERMAKSEERMAKSDERMAKSDERMAKSDERMAENDSRFIYLEDQNSVLLKAVLSHSEKLDTQMELLLAAHKELGKHDEEIAELRRDTKQMGARQDAVLQEIMRLSQRVNNL